MNVAGCVVTAEGREVNALDRPDQPRRLPILLDRPPSDHARCTSLGSAPIDDRLLDPFEVEVGACVAVDCPRDVFRDLHEP